MPKNRSLTHRALAGTTLALALTLATALLPGCSQPTPPADSHSTPSANPATTQVRLYFTKGFDANGSPAVAAVDRAVPKAEGTLAAALTELLKGPTEQERNAGYTSWFSAKTAGMLNGVSLQEDGLAVVDFKDFRNIIPNASSSTGSAELLGSLGWTIAQFPTVKKIEYRFDGDPAPFYEWLQIGRTVQFDAARYR